MIFLVVAQLASLVLDLFTISRLSERHKDLQILLLRQQLRILQRQHSKALALSRRQKLTLAVLTAKLNGLCPHAKTKLDAVLLLVKPDTVLKWHRELVRRKWTFKQPLFIPRRQSDSELVALLLRLARENPRWGYSRLHGGIAQTWL